MGIADKVSGRVKKAAGDLADDDALRREGEMQERKGRVKDELAREEERAEAARAQAEEKAREVDRLDRAT
jgi:uncharacterized protein YjbJ (UPF0337 family)